MKDIIYEVGFLITYALEKLDKSQIFNPIYFAIKEDNIKIKEEIKDISLENSVNKVLDLLSFNEIEAKCASAIFPAELEDENKQRYSVIVAMVSNYLDGEYLTLAQPYKLENNELKILKYETLDYCPTIENRLSELEQYFLAGIKSYDSTLSFWENS